MPSYILQEDGSSKFTLEEGVGFLLLEEVVTPRRVEPVQFVPLHFGNRW